MRETLLSLVKLQEIDGKAFELERAAGRFPVRIRELEAGLNVQRSELGALRSELETKKREQFELEGVAKDETAKHQKWKRRLNDIKTPREYQALSREIEQGERQQRELEERVVALMGEIEAKQAVVATKEAELRAKEAEVAQAVRDLRIEEEKLNREATAARAGREAIVAKIPARVLTLYERVRERRGGSAIATATNSCSGCNVALRPQLVVEVRKLTSVEQCPSCSRILIAEVLLVTRDQGPSAPLESA